MTSYTSNVKSALQGLTVGFIGCGDLGKAILKGVSYESASSPQMPDSWALARYLASVQSEKTAQALREFFQSASDAGGSINLEVFQRQNVQIAQKSDFVILASPPGAVETILSEKGMAEALSQKVLVSLAAGVTMSQMETALYQPKSDSPNVSDQNRCWIVRAMPNIAASLAASATAITVSTDLAPPKDKIEIVESFFQCVGGITHITESQMDAAFFCDAIIDGAVAGGLPRGQAEAMTAQALASTAALLAADGGGKRPSEVRENVCANPGITIGGILDLEKGGVRGSISGAVRDSILAARSLGRKDG
ncbi:hypothetical protein J7T55_015639 [Diaporthe amygdali]|uniref:uncharacterized protein n=1 Tax=Phomopsis amygdali TaxID=1214568 RepID=UPI0022FF178C|nr:uncharacterized protein J7T55_015639 [Diaporthe amygdali]KAJ0120901.1 hypothetical protein J7T55_015639 [Diaporthe amygdali]